MRTFSLRVGDPDERAFARWLAVGLARLFSGPSRELGGGGSPGQEEPPGGVKRGQLTRPRSDVLLTPVGSAAA